MFGFCQSVHLGRQVFTLIFIFNLYAEHILCCTAGRFSLASILRCGLAVSHCRSSLWMVPLPATCRHIGLQPSALGQELSQELHVASMMVVFSRDEIVCQENSVALVSILLVYHKTQSVLKRVVVSSSYAWRKYTCCSESGCWQGWEQLQVSPIPVQCSFCLLSPVTPQILL